MTYYRWKSKRGGDSPFCGGLAQRKVDKFLVTQRLSMTGKDSNAYRPKEWFSVSFDTALEVMTLIVPGEILPNE